MAKRPSDHDLDFLKGCTKDELEPIVGAIMGTDDSGNIDKKGRLSSELQNSAGFKLYYPNHTKYVDEIIEELQKFGGNTFLNLARGCGVSYHEILCDVCDKMDVNYNKLSETEVIETQLLGKVLADAWEKLSQADRDKILKEVGGGHGSVGGFSCSAFIAIFQAGGFAGFRLATTIVATLAKIILGRSLPFAAYTGMASALAVITGPVGMAIAGLWTALDLGSAAYRVTIPATVYIAALRKMKSSESSQEVKDVLAGHKEG